MSNGFVDVGHNVGDPLEVQLRLRGRAQGLRLLSVLMADLVFTDSYGATWSHQDWIVTEYNLVSCVRPCEREKINSESLILFYIVHILKDLCRVMRLDLLRRRLSERQSSTNKISICTKIIKYYLILNFNIGANFEIFPHWHSLQFSSYPHHKSRPRGGQRGIPAPGLILRVGIVSWHSPARRPLSVSRILTRCSRMTRNWHWRPLDIPDLSGQRVLSLRSICNCQDIPDAKTDPLVHKIDRPGQESLHQNNCNWNVNTPSLDY